MWRDVLESHSHTLRYGKSWKMISRLGARVSNDEISMVPQNFSPAPPKQNRLFGLAFLLQLAAVLFLSFAGLGREKSWTFLQGTGS